MRLIRRAAFLSVCSVAAAQSFATPAHADANALAEATAVAILGLEPSDLEKVGPGALRAKTDASMQVVVRDQSSVNCIVDVYGRPGRSIEEAGDRYTFSALKMISYQPAPDEKSNAASLLIFGKDIKCIVTGSADAPVVSGCTSAAHLPIVSLEDLERRRSALKSLHISQCGSRIGGKPA